MEEFESVITISFVNSSLTAYLTFYLTVPYLNRVLNDALHTELSYGTLFIKGSSFDVRTDDLLSIKYQFDKLTK